MAKPKGGSSPHRFSQFFSPAALSPLLPDVLHAQKTAGPVILRWGNATQIGEEEIRG